MKGPYERLKYDLRRVWECPNCKRRERAAGSVTFRFCACQTKQTEGKQTPMKLVDEAVQQTGARVQIRRIAEPVSASITETANGLSPAEPTAQNLTADVPPADQPFDPS